MLLCPCAGSSGRGRADVAQRAPPGPAAGHRLPHHRGHLPCERVLRHDACLLRALLFEMRHAVETVDLWFVGFLYKPWLATSLWAQVIHEGKDPVQVVTENMSRPLKPEVRCTCMHASTGQAAAPGAKQFWLYSWPDHAAIPALPAGQHSGGRGGAAHRGAPHWRQLTCAAALRSVETQLIDWRVSVLLHGLYEV